jgi:isopropylmalate/homocitrate/citramalate synthase
MPARLTIQDVTLREGQQAAEIAFSMREKVDIASRLAAAGLRRLQAGYAGTDDDTIAALKRSVPELEVSALLVAFRDGWEVAAESAAAAGVDVLMVLFRIAPGQLEAIGFSQEEALDRIGRSVERSLQLVPIVSFDPSFVTLAEAGFMRHAYAAAAQAGARHFGVADSTGVANPERIAELVKLIRRLTGGEVSVHCHDDFGLALANTLAGISAGASLADSSLLGLGERAGNCATEELAVALEFLYNVATGVNLEHLTGLAEYISQITGFRISPTKAIVGTDAFSQKLDMHVALTRRDPSLLEPFSPHLVGNRRRLRLGLGTGPVAVKAKLEQLGLPTVEESRAQDLANWVNEMARLRKAAVSDDDFRQHVTGEASAASMTRATEGK